MANNVIGDSFKKNGRTNNVNGGTFRKKGMANNVIDGIQKIRKSATNVFNTYSAIIVHTFAYSLLPGIFHIFIQPASHLPKHV